LRVTRDVCLGKITGQSARNMWERDQIMAAVRAADEGKIVRKECGPRSRALVETMYGISIEQQLKIEEYLANKQDLSPISCEWITSIMPEVWRDYSINYVRYVHRAFINKEAFTLSGVDHLSQLLNLDGVEMSRRVEDRWGQTDSQ